MKFWVSMIPGEVANKEGWYEIWNGDKESERLGFLFWFFLLLKKKGKRRQNQMGVGSVSQADWEENEGRKHIMAVDLLLFFSGLQKTKEIRNKSERNTNGPNAQIPKYPNVQIK